MADFELHSLLSKLGVYELEALKQRKARLFDQEAKKVEAKYKKRLRNAAIGMAHKKEIFNQSLEELKEWERREEIANYMLAQGTTIRKQVIGFVLYQKKENDRKSFTVNDIFVIAPGLKYSTIRFVLNELVISRVLEYIPPHTTGRGSYGVYSFPIKDKKGKL